MATTKKKDPAETKASLTKKLKSAEKRINKLADELATLTTNYIEVFQKYSDGKQEVIETMGKLISLQVKHNKLQDDYTMTLRGVTGEIPSHELC
jgi:hypothetical protein